MLAGFSFKELRLGCSGSAPLFKVFRQRYWEMAVRINRGEIEVVDNSVWIGPSAFLLSNMSLCPTLITKLSPNIDT